MSRAFWKSCRASAKRPSPICELRLVVQVDCQPLPTPWPSLSSDVFPIFQVLLCLFQIANLGPRGPQAVQVVGQRGIPRSWLLLLDGERLGVELHAVVVAPPLEGHVPEEGEALRHAELVVAAGQAITKFEGAVQELLGVVVGTQAEIDLSDHVHQVGPRPRVEDDSSGGYRRPTRRALSGVEQLPRAFIEDLTDGEVFSPVLLRIGATEQTLQKTGEALSFNALLFRLEALLLGLAALLLGLEALFLCPVTLATNLIRLIARDSREHDDRQHERRSQLVADQRASQPVGDGGRMGSHWPSIEMPLDILRESRGRGIAPLGLALQGLADDGVEIALQLAGEPAVAVQGAHGLARRALGPAWTQLPLHGRGVAPHQQLIEKDAEAIDVRGRGHRPSRHLLGARVVRGHGMSMGSGQLGEPTGSSGCQQLGDAEIEKLRLAVRRSTRMLPGFRSRWTTRFWWANWTAAQTLTKSRSRLRPRSSSRAQYEGWAGPRRTP